MYILHFKFLMRYLIGLEPIFILYNPAVNAIDWSPWKSDIDQSNSLLRHEHYNQY